MMFRSAIAAASLMALPMVANAQAVNGPYIGLGAGINFMQQEHVTAGGGSGDLKSRIGPAFVGSAGWGFGNGLRVELEGNYRVNTFNNLAGSSTAAGGREQKFGAMGNVLYDFVGLTPMVQPYVGVGAGYEWAKEQNDYVGPGTWSGTKGAFAYQGILGAAFPIAAAPGLAITAEYRFMGLAGNRSYSNGVTMSKDYNHSALFGIRYAFGAAPAPMAAAPMATPAPAVTPARSYLVFFDWDKATLTDRARGIIKEAADNSTRVQYTQIAVNGYADTSGTPQYNQGLSVRRAQTVAAELVKDGVPKTAISIKGFGDTVLLVPTGAGVREPQNRRVEIIIK